MKRRGMGEGVPEKENIFASISSCEKLREVLSWIDTQVDNQYAKRMVVVVPEEASLLGEMKMMVQKLRKKIQLMLLLPLFPLLFENKKLRNMG